jgi:ribosome maturation factor RimP
MNLEHFKMSIGEILSVVITGQLSEEQTAGSPKGLNLKSDKKFRGKLVEANQDEYVIEVKGFNLKLNYKQTKKVNLDPDLKSVKE